MKTKTESRIICIRAETPQDLDRVYRLRYACYRRDNSIDPCADEAFSDDFDLLPNQFSFLALSGPGHAVATVRISVVRPDLGWTQAPSQKVFGDHPVYERIAQGSFVEASRLCFAERARRDSLMQVTSYLAALADFYEVDWIVACPRSQQSRTYERLFGFERLAEPRPYFGVRFKTSLLATSPDKLKSYTAGTKAMNSARGSAFDTLLNQERGVNQIQ